LIPALWPSRKTSTERYLTQIKEKSASRHSKVVSAEAVHAVSVGSIPEM